MEYIVIGVVALIIFVLIKLWGMIWRLEQQVKAMQFKIDHLEQPSDTFENPIDDELRVLIEAGQDVKAVKKARESLGLSLIEGKEYIDRLKLTLDNN